MISDTKRRMRRAKDAERNSGRWLLEFDGPDPRWASIASSTGRVGHYHELQFDVISFHYAGEVKNIKLPARIWKFWTQIVDVAQGQGKEPLLLVVPNNIAPKKYPNLHVITAERHRQLLEKERVADAYSFDSEL